MTLLQGTRESAMATLKQGLNRNRRTVADKEAYTAHIVKEKDSYASSGLQVKSLSCKSGIVLSHR